MTNKDENTEQRILTAARQVFTNKGLDGARMQEIADEAGINKALLHYYFRNKEKLFEAIFTEAVSTLLPNIIQALESKESFFDKIRIFTSQYVDLLVENPLIPSFVLNELTHHPQRIAKLIKDSGFNPMAFAIEIQQEIDSGRIKPVKPIHLIVNMLAMCIFPFAARPIIQNILLNNDEQLFQEFIQQRKTEVSDFIINAIKNE